MTVRPATGVGRPAPPRRRSARAWWLRQFHTWHWISAAVSLIGMLAFTLTGVTLNHAGLIPATPHVEERSAKLPASLTRLLAAPPRGADAPLPAAVAAGVRDAVRLDPAGLPAEWTNEAYVALPRPGGDAWVSVDRSTGAVRAEVTSQGWLSYLNDLHKGRNTGFAWRLFIDVFAAAATIFTLTGLLLLQIHAARRRSTWPLVALGLVVPLLVAVLLVH